MFDGFNRQPISVCTLYLFVSKCRHLGTIVCRIYALKASKDVNIIGCDAVDVRYIVFQDDKTATILPTHM